MHGVRVGCVEGRGGIEHVGKRVVSCSQNLARVWLRETRKRGSVCNRKEMMKMKGLAHPFREEVYYL